MMDLVVKNIKASCNYAQGFKKHKHNERPARHKKEPNDII